MVVILIIGILATFLSLSIGNRALEDRMEAEARRLQQLVQLASEEAQLKGMELGLRYTEDGFEFLALTDAGRWQSFDGGPLRPREITEPFYLRLYVEGREIAPLKIDRDKERQALQAAEKAAEKAAEEAAEDGQRDESHQSEELPQPQVLLLSSGESTPFALDLRLRNHAGFYRLDCDLLSRCKLEHQRQDAS